MSRGGILMCDLSRTRSQWGNYGSSDLDYTYLGLGFSRCSDIL